MIAIRKADWFCFVLFSFSIMKRSNVKKKKKGFHFHCCLETLENYFNNNRVDFILFAFRAFLLYFMILFPSLT